MVLIFEEEPNTDDCEFCGDIFCFGSCEEEDFYFPFYDDDYFEREELDER